MTKANYVKARKLMKKCKVTGYYDRQSKNVISIKPHFYNTNEKVVKQVREGLSRLADNITFETDFEGEKFMKRFRFTMKIDKKWREREKIDELTKTLRNFNTALKRRKIASVINMNDCLGKIYFDLYDSVAYYGANKKENEYVELSTGKERLFDNEDEITKLCKRYFGDDYSVEKKEKVANFGYKETARKGYDKNGDEVMVQSMIITIKKQH